MSTRRPALRTVFATAIVIVVAVLTLGSTFLATGPFGLVIAADCLAALGLIVAVAAVPRGLRDLPRQRRGAWAWLKEVMFWRRGDAGPQVQTADFPTYAKISSDLSWAPMSQWHYDHGIRPLLTRLAASALAEHHRVDLAAAPARARSLVGEEVWPHVDPSRAASFDSKAPGADLGTLTRIVDRLEEL
jgi:hypothetical protein